MHWKEAIKYIKENFTIPEICDYLGIGYKESKISSYYYILSPYGGKKGKSQKTESIVVFRNSKVADNEYGGFYDYATGKAGDIIEFVKYYFAHNSTRAALEQIAQAIGLQITDTYDNNYSPPPPPPPKPKPQKQEQKQEQKSQNIEIRSIKELQNKALIKYLEQRGIPKEIAAKAGVKELYYRLQNKEKDYFGLVFENDKGGYELRNPYFKGNLKAKSITTIINQNSNEINIFEGFMDYLSAIKLSDGKVLEQNNIILNSVAEKQKAIEKIKELKHINKVKLYLDADEAGKLAAKDFKEAFKDSGIEVVDYSYLLQKNDVKDLNEFLMKKEGLLEQENQQQQRNEDEFER